VGHGAGHPALGQSRRQRTDALFAVVLAHVLACGQKIESTLLRRHRTLRVGHSPSLATGFPLRRLSAAAAFERSGTPGGSEARSAFVPATSETCSGHSAINGSGSM